MKNLKIGDQVVNKLNGERFIVQGFKMTENGYAFDEADLNALKKRIGLNAGSDVLVICYGLDSTGKQIRKYYSVLLLEW